VSAVLVVLTTLTVVLAARVGGARGA
jgi:hypothetical protein